MREDWFDEYEHDAICVEHGRIDWKAVVEAYEREAMEDAE